MYITISQNTKEKCFNMAKKWVEDGYNIWSGVYEEKRGRKTMYCADLYKYADMTDEELKNVIVGNSGYYENMKL